MNLNSKFENSIKQMEPIVTIINDCQDLVEFNRRNSSNQQAVEKKDDLLESQTDLEYLDWWCKYHSSVQEDYDEPVKQAERVNETDLDTASEEVEESELNSDGKRAIKRRKKRLRHRRVKVKRESFFSHFKSKRKMRTHQKTNHMPKKEALNNAGPSKSKIPIITKPKIENIEVNAC